MFFIVCRSAPRSAFAPIEKGVTLIELMVVIATVAILAAIAVPSFQSTIERNRLNAAIQDLKGALQLARTVALKKSVDVTFTPTPGNDGSWCYQYDDVTCASNLNKHATISLGPSPATAITFNGRRGTSDTGTTYTLTSNNLTSDIIISQAGSISATDP